MTESILVLGGPGGEVRRCQRGWGSILQGLLGLSPTCFVCSTHTPPNSPQRRSNSFSHGAKGLRKRAARPVGRYLLHAEGYSVSGPCPQPLRGVLFCFFGFWFWFVFLFFVLGFLFFFCFVWHFVSIPASESRDSTWVRRGTPGKIGRALGKNHVEQFWFLAWSELPPGRK